MNRKQFNQALRGHLSSLPEQEIDKSLTYFNEMIDDRLEDGMTEEEAVADIGPVHEIADKLLATEEPIFQRVKAQVLPKRRLEGWEKVLLVLGFPLWGSIVLSGIFLLLILALAYFALMIAAGSLVLSGGLVILAAFFRIFQGLDIFVFTLATGLTAMGLGFLAMTAILSLGKWLKQVYFRFRKKL